MDLGCMDMGCVENPKREAAAGKENSPKECSSSANKFGKNDRAKDALRSSLTALNKLTSQICKPPYRKTSPINWFPRKKMEPYLKRKIKMLQEVNGMCSTLDEALGDSNPHYSRVLREKIAIKEAANKAVECRKAAMVEASWCRILNAARIETKEAEANLLKAEADAAEALEVAREAGVIMNDIPLDSARNHCKVETTVSATFETGFEVDKQVAAAVKAAFIKLASCPSISKDEFKELLRKISENPDTDENCLFSDPTAEFVSDAGPDEEKKPKRKLESSSKFDMDSIIDMMLDRLCGLKEEELASLATIVATSGLNAALSGMGTDDDDKQEQNGDVMMMPLGGKMARKNATRQTNTTEAELPSLDKFLVKRLTRLEREVLEAKNGRENEAGIGNKRRLDDDNIRFGGNKSPRIELVVENVATTVSDFGVSQAKRHSPELKEEEVQKNKRWITAAEASSDLPSLDKFLVKHVTRLEREILEAKRRRDNNDSLEEVDSVDHPKEKPMRGVEKSKEESSSSSYESLDKVLVKHISRLEREKQDFNANALFEPKKKGKRENNTEEGPGLDQILVKRKSKLEVEKNAGDDDGSSRKHFVSRRETREKELLQAAWGGLSLGNSMRPHADWLRAEEEERKKNNHE
ncbi:hypothetical protein M569_01555 [Genlisea aurea]|uniref:Uncharacterized protein n=1 Tax=Genlisea aurea TaxID=192259 RepID=S8D1C4_9LAMI|nr:hypothetical protein M569_01555 [Genlisea aurea]